MNDRPDAVTLDRARERIADALVSLSGTTETIAGLEASWSDVETAVDELRRAAEWLETRCILARKR